MKRKDGFGSTHLQFGCTLRVRENSRRNLRQRLHVQAHIALPPVRGCLAKEMVRADSGASGYCKLLECICGGTGLLEV